MRTAFLNSIAIGAGLALAPASLFAHHSFAAEFDASKPITLTGAITKVEWMNPHTRIYMDVKDDKGVVTNWELELGSPNGLMHAGWTRNSVKPGDVGYGQRLEFAASMSSIKPSRLGGIGAIAGLVAWSRQAIGFV